VEAGANIELDPAALDQNIPRYFVGYRTEYFGIVAQVGHNRTGRSRRPGAQPAEQEGREGGRLLPAMRGEVKNSGFLVVIYVTSSFPEAVRAPHYHGPR
jgi:hypothetical protein